MKNLDEIKELMADEMKDFQLSLLQLQKISNELQNHSIPISTEVMEKHLDSFFQKQEKREALATERLIAIDKKLKDAYILPKNLGMIFGSFLILLITLIGYLSVELIATKNENFEVEQMMKEEPTDLYDQYFLEKPELKEGYENWLQNQNIP